MRLVKACLFACVLVAAFVGCGLGVSDESQTLTNADLGEYLLKSEPAGAENVIAVMQNAADGDDVVVVGRIGGRSDPWMEGLAAFSLADVSLVPCNEREGDQCPTPWDYCCESDVRSSHTLVKIVDGQGDIVPRSARQLLPLKELQTVVIQGTARRDETGNLSLLATGVYVRP